MIFYFLFCILFFLSFIYYSGKKYPLTQTAYLSFCVFLLFLIIAGGRNNVGTDWWQYKETFDNYVRAGTIPKGKKEIGFNELSWSLKDFDGIKLQRIHKK